jgi:hypothetical protein
MVDDKNKPPEIRCRQIRSKIKSLELLDPAVRKRILERFSKDTMQAIQKAKDDQWLPVEYNIALAECAAAETSEEGVFDWSCKAVSYSIKSSVVGPFFIASMNMFKFKPSSVLKVAPQLWKSIYRNCGEFGSSQISANCVHCMIKGLPLVMLRSRPYLIGIAAFIQALGELGDAAKSKTTLSQYSEVDRNAIIEFTWDDQQK